MVESASWISWIAVKKKIFIFAYIYEHPNPIYFQGDQRQKSPATRDASRECPVDSDRGAFESLHSGKPRCLRQKVYAIRTRARPLQGNRRSGVPRHGTTNSSQEFESIQSELRSRRKACSFGNHAHPRPDSQTYQKSTRAHAQRGESKYDEKAIDRHGTGERDACSEIGQWSLERQSSPSPRSCPIVAGTPIYAAAHPDFLIYTAADVVPAAAAIANSFHASVLPTWTRRDGAHATAPRSYPGSRHVR